MSLVNEDEGMVVLCSSLMEFFFIVTFDLICLVVVVCHFCL